MDETPAIDPNTRAALQSLADIVQPPPVAYWPQTWGWALLAAVLVVLVALAMWRWLHRRRLNRYRREALAVLAALDRTAAEGRPADAVRAVAELLKRVALAAWPRAVVASLSGKPWVTFLNEHGGGTVIADDTAKLLEDGEYRSVNAPGEPTGRQFRALIESARTWIGSHRVSA